MQHVLQQPEFDEYGVKLTKFLIENWAFLNALRDYYQRFHVPPPTARLCHELHLKHGCGHMLFPSCLTAWRIAGLPDPGEEAKSYLSAE